MKRLAALSAAAILCVSAAHAEEGETTASVDDPIAMKALAARLNDEARDIRSAAEVEHAKAEKTCWKQFMVSRCLDEAGQTWRDEKLKAAKLESRARAIQRELKRREIAAKEARRAEKEAAQAGKQ
jgi:colicin import membrane protein